MVINNSFEVPLPPGDAWKVLMDIPRIAPCMPGAELTGCRRQEHLQRQGLGQARAGRADLRGQVKFTEIDEAAHKARVKAQGKDSKGRGGANANVDFHIEPVPAGSRVLVKTDLTLSGAVAQYGRASGMIQDVAPQLIGQFANALKAQLAASQTLPPRSSATAAYASPPPRSRRSRRRSRAFRLLLMVLGEFFPPPVRQRQSMTTGCMRHG